MRGFLWFLAGVVFAAAIAGGVYYFTRETKHVFSVSQECIGDSSIGCARGEASKACKTRSEVADDPSHYAVKVKIQQMGKHNWFAKVGPPLYYRFECTDFYGGE